MLITSRRTDKGRDKNEDIDDCSHQRSLTEWSKTGNRYETLRQEMKIHAHGEIISCGIITQPRH